MLTRRTALKTAGIAALATALPKTALAWTDLTDYQNPRDYHPQKKRGEDNMNQLEQYVQDHLDEYVREGIFPIIEAEAVSAQKSPEQMLPSAEKVKSVMKNHGLENLQILQEAGSYPAIFGEIRSSNPHAPTILIQGHYDGQPSDATEWTPVQDAHGNFINVHPHKPVIVQENGERRVHGRGTSDDWGQVMTHLAAVDAYRKTGTPLPCNIKFLIEGGEEVGSKNMDQLIEKHKELLATDVVMITDSGPGREGHPVITTLARGLAKAYITHTTGTNAAHSGENIAPNALSEIMGIFSSMKDSKTQKILIPGFYELIPTVSAEERKRLNQMPFDTELFKRTYGLRRIVVEEGFTPQETMWTRPSLEMHILEGGSFSNSIPYKIKAMITMRVPPGTDPEGLYSAFRKEFERKATEMNIPLEEFQFETDHFGQSFSTKTDHPYFKAAEKALEEAFGASVDFMGCGGTEPIAVFHQQILRVPVILNGVNGPEDNYHGHHESLSIEKGFLRGIIAQMLFYQYAAEITK